MDFLLAVVEVSIKTDLLKHLVVMVAAVTEVLDRVQVVLTKLELQTQAEVQVADLLLLQVVQV